MSPYESSCARRAIPAFLFVAAIGLTRSTPVSAQGVEPLRGDFDADGRLAITDAIASLNYLFLGGNPPPCVPVADVDDNGAVQITDAVALLGFLFLGTGAPTPLDAADIAECRPEDPEAIQRGMEVFESSDPNGNLFSCSLCHSAIPDAESDIQRPGHDLARVLARPSFKNGALTRFVDAANTCRTYWMVTDPWADDAPALLDLTAFLASMPGADEPAPSPELVYEIVAPSVTGPSSGDADQGCQLFNSSCSICHGEDAVGTNFAPSLISPFVVAVDDPDYVRQRIRLSGPAGETVYGRPDLELLGTVMPFWSRDKLSDGDVEDLVAYLAASRESVRTADVPLSCPDPMSPDGVVLRSGEIDGSFSAGGERTERVFHGVRGIVEELDTRRIRIRDFDFDGGGIVVKLYLLADGAPIRSGLAIGPDLFGTPRSGATLVVELPEGTTTPDFDWVSVWCVAARQDFGSARLRPIERQEPARE
jgi:mono/diheme cytochrome c family protein